MLAYPCILFDLDDTLLDCGREPRQSSARVSRTRGAATRARLLDPETPAVLIALAERGVKLGIVTSAPRWSAVPALRATHLLPLFSRCLVTAEDCRLRKPHPAPLWRALHALEAAPAETLYVGDTAEDAAAARACGLHFALAGWSRTEAEQPGIPHDWLLEQIVDLLPLIGLSGKGARGALSHLE